MFITFIIIFSINTQADYYVEQHVYGDMHFKDCKSRVLYPGSRFYLVLHCFWCTLMDYSTKQNDNTNVKNLPMLVNGRENMDLNNDSFPSMLKIKNIKNISFMF